MSKRAREEEAAEEAAGEEPIIAQLAGDEDDVPVRFQTGPFMVGGYAQDFSAPALVNGEIVEEWNLSENVEGKYAVLLCYPLDFTFVCPSELHEIQDRYAEFEALDCPVVAWSVDSIHAHASWATIPRSEGGLGATKDKPLSFPLVSDLNHDISEGYGCLWDGKGHTLRGTFIISDQGIVRHASLTDDPVGRSVDEILRLVRAFKFVDSNEGQVCPMGWNKAGDATITADQGKKGEYFAEKNK